MLEELHIRDLALIEEVWLPFGEGLTVLTGETGAGKTVLLSALQLLMGGRGDANMLRPGADSAQVEAQFSGELVAARTLMVGGRNRCLLDGDLSTVGALAETIGPLIDLHGQHDHQELLHPSNHLDYLDRSAAARIAPLQSAYQEALEAWREAREAREALQAQLSASAEQLEAGRIALAEIERIDPQPGEDDEIRSSLPALENAEELAGLCETAYGALHDEGAALDRLSRAREALEQAARFEPALDEQRAQIAEASVLLSDVADSLRDSLGRIEHDPAALETRLNRLAELDGLAKRFGPSLEQVLALRDRLAATAAVTGSGDEALAAARAAEAQAQTGLQEAAQRLAGERRAQATSFLEQLAAAAAPLQLGTVRFDFSFEDLPFERWTSSGSQKLEILYAPTPDSALRPLARIASGGELSRVMLALQTVLGSGDDGKTLIFDEIDTGIGGAVATAVGKALKELARHHQVIVVTHLAQVAAYGDAHYVVRKQDEGTGGQVVTTVSPVTGSYRTAEIARMLSGETSEAALAHAEEVLAGAAG
ncbi:MAG: DNA repair protein RecN [Actinomycetia bacterium]|nr:DNA repair protein RecN [Actinomycetes bacterium]